MSVTLICQYEPCSQEFSVKPYKAAIARFCSQDCRWLWRSTQQLATFWDKVQICSHGFDCIYCCWPWQGTTENVYKNTTVHNKFVLVHRLAWELGNNRQIPDGLHIAHWCHWKPCCNPNHLRPATPLENSADSVRDHRMMAGEQHTNSKLTKKAVLEVFRLKVLGWSHNAITDFLSVEMAITISTSTIDSLLAGRLWKDVPRPAELTDVARKPKATFHIFSREEPPHA